MLRSHISSVVTSATPWLQLSIEVFQLMEKFENSRKYIFRLARFFSTTFLILFFMLFSEKYFYVGYICYIRFAGCHTNWNGSNSIFQFVDFVRFSRKLLSVTTFPAM